MSPSLRLWDFRLAYQLLYPRWANVGHAPEEGYAIFLPVPSDLPFLYRLAINNIAQQNLEHANEILVIPDISTVAFRALVADTKPTCLDVPVRYCQDNIVRRLGARLWNSACFYYFTQLACGINHTRSRFALLHDADLFLTDSNFIEGQYQEISSRDLDLFGVDRVWDSWYAENGYPHVTATWEMMLSTKWARSFRPILHRGHTNTVNGRSHKFDVTLLPQCFTPPGQIGRREISDSFIHFNYVIGTYRQYLKQRSSFMDEKFIIPLLRLLIDEFDPYVPYSTLPSWSEITHMLQGHARYNLLPFDDGRNEKYVETRGKLERLLNSSLVSESSAARMRERLLPFDKRYHFEVLPHQTDSQCSGNAREMTLIRA